MKIGSQEFAIGEVVPADVVAAAAPIFYAACEKFRSEPYGSATHDVTAPYTMVGVMLADDPNERDWQKREEHYQKRIKAASKKGEILMFGDEYLPQESLRGKYFVAKCMGLARKRHPEADEAIRIQDATHRYDTSCTTPFTREVK